MTTGRIDQIVCDNRKQTDAKNAKLPIAGPDSTGASGTWPKPTVERPYCGQCIRAPTRYHSDMLRPIVTKGSEPGKETASLVSPMRPALSHTGLGDTHGALRGPEGRWTAHGSAD